MGAAVFTLCMRTGKKHTNPQWTPTVIECDSLCILSIAPGSWQLIGIYSSLNHWWTPQRGWVVRRRWHGTLILLTLKMRAGMRGKLEAPMQNDKMCAYLCVSVFIHARVCECECRLVHGQVCLCLHRLYFNGLWVENVTVALIAVYYDCCQRQSVCRFKFNCFSGDTVHFCV